MFELIIGAVVLFLSALILYKPFIDLCKTFIRARHFSRIKIDQGKNTDEQARNDFLNLIRMADERIEIFDDGDDMPESVYQDSGIVSAIRKKLLDIQDFKIECYFNDDNDLLFRKELENEDRVRIRAGIDHDRPVEETHYKIVDNGKIAYLSRHGHKESERNYRREDCSALTGKALDETAQALFGKYRNGVQGKVSRMTGELS